MNSTRQQGFKIISDKFVRWRTKLKNSHLNFLPFWQYCIRVLAHKKQRYHWILKFSIKKWIPDVWRPRRRRQKKRWRYPIDYLRSVSPMASIICPSRLRRSCSCSYKNSANMSLYKRVVHTSYFIYNKYLWIILRRWRRQFGGKYTHTFSPK